MAPSRDDLGGALRSGEKWARRLGSSDAFLSWLKRNYPDTVAGRHAVERTLDLRDAQVIKEEVEFFKERLQQMEERARGLFAPAETSSDSHDDEAPAAAPEEGRPRGGAWGLFAVGMALIMVGMILVFNNFALLWWLDLGRLWPLTFIAVGFVLLLSRRGR